MTPGQDASADGKIYVIMPISVDADAPKKKEAIARCAARRHLTPHFPMENVIAGEGPRQAVDRAVTSINRARLVIADLSYERPSCYYELGLAEALGAAVSLIAADGTDIHQSSNRELVRFYSNLASYERVINDILASID